MSTLTHIIPMKLRVNYMVCVPTIYQAVS